MSCFINGSLFTEVPPLCRCWIFLKANMSPGLKTCFGSLWTCAQCAGGPLSEVFCMGSVCTCGESTCFALIAGAEGVVVLKGVSITGAVHTVLELYWHCMALHLFHMSCRIWKMFDVPSSVPLTVPFPVLAQEIPCCVPCDVQCAVSFPVLPSFTLLKFGILSPFTTFSSE